MSDLRKHALAYGRAGLAVLPLVPQEKRPHGMLAPHGKDDATTDLEQIEQWWRRCPNANIGVRPPVGAVVVDVDPRHGGHLELRKLTAQHGALPLTWQADTGSNGMHLWFWARGDFRSELRPGIDLKDHRGYLVMPPSIHPNGRRYEWATDAPIARAPGWLLPLLRKPPRAERPAPAVQHKGKGEPLLRFVAGAQEGNRNNALFWAACRAVSDGILDEIRGELVAVARGIGLSDSEIETTIESAKGRAA